MKKFTAFISVLLAMLFLLCACGESNTPPADGGDPEPDEEYSLPLEDGKKQLTIYYKRSVGYSDCDIWLWYGTVAGRGYVFHDCAYGAKVVVNVPESIEEVGFIIRTGCSDPGGTSWGSASKDGTESDRSVKLKERETVIYTQAGDANAYTSNDGGITLDEMKSVTTADLIDTTHVKYVLSAAMSIQLSDVRLTTADGAQIELESLTGGASYGTVQTKQPLDVSKAYTLTVADMEPVPVIPVSYFNSAEFKENYLYDGKLGVELNANETTFRLWAPTASAVTLNLYAKGNGGSAEKSVPLVKGEKGVWSYTESASLAGKYYTYTVTTSAGKQTAVDPYAVSAGRNGDRGMILDMNASAPENWENESFTPAGVENYTDAEIWEVQVRDFSNGIASSQYKGKYLAFTETGLKNEAGEAVGVDYLKELGITHVHLMPAFDFASVDESPTVSGYNWGYDPKNYNVPEGSYSTNADDGSVRVKEFRQMVQALHENGIGVIMDVVYNHTYDGNSNFNKIVPYYYYRYQANGVMSNGSGCGNETASDREMFRRYMVDSVTHWMKEYHVDGFRFDLMALHDIETMQAIEQAVHAINPKALLYGEGWTGGTSELSAGKQSSLANLKSLNSKTKTNGIAMFNDVIRDAIKGSVFDSKDPGFATGAKASASQAIRFGVNGSVRNSAFGANNASWEAHNPTNVVNYASAHDNHTLWDRICILYGKKAEAFDEACLKRNALSAAIVQTSLGIPFMQAGEEMLRTKKNADGTYNENSYNSSDKVNNLNWNALAPDSPQKAMSEYYKGLIAFRKSCKTLRLPSSEGVCTLVKAEGALIAFTMTNPSTGEQLFVVYNAGENTAKVELPAGSWDLYISGMQAGATAISTAHTGVQDVQAISCSVYRKSN